MAVERRVPREAPPDDFSTQRELLQELHDDRARALEDRLVGLVAKQLEQRSGAAHAGLRRSIDSLLPFIIGLIIGVLATYGAFSGRIATLESVTAQHTEQLRQNRADMDAYVRQTADAIEKINEKLSARGAH